MSEEILVTFSKGKRVDAEYKGFVINTDQPVYQRGDASAPTPFDLFLASIATCSGYYVLSFCQGREIPVEKISLVMNTEKDPETKMIKKISIQVLLPPEFPEKYKKPVLKAIDSCTVKKQMTNPPAFELTTAVT